MFQFRPEWKERLVVTGPGGAFELDLPMGVLSAHLPSAVTWAETAPDWARDLWPVLHEELAQWCLDHGADLYVSHAATAIWL
ncbi:hypothetical protein [Sphingomonas trueperi]|uniref:hypothetical protein n=1 Tax=Sphingomonas trueperi TaxID=53317 RepID=UPI001602D656